MINLDIRFTVLFHVSHCLLLSQVLELLGLLTVWPGAQDVVRVQRQGVHPVAVPLELIPRDLESAVLRLKIRIR